MSAVKQMRQMIAGLMGTSSYGADDTCKEKLSFSSPRVCKSFLLSCCPHEILAQTRFDLGKCPKLHDVALKADFEKSKKYEHEFQVESYEQLKTFIAESKRRSQIAKIRLAITQDVLSIEEGRKIDYVHQIDNAINETIKQVERLGADGKVEESLKLLKEVDALKEEKSRIISEFKNQTPASLSQQKRLRVCEICSSYLGLNDNDKRLADHFNGKLHLGFLYIREKFNELEKLIQERLIKDVLESEFKSFESNKRILIDSPKNLHKYFKHSTKVDKTTEDHLPEKKTFEKDGLAFSDVKSTL